MLAKFSCTRFEIYAVCGSCGQKLEPLASDSSLVRHPLAQQGPPWDRRDGPVQCAFAGKVFRNPTLVEVEEVRV
jgi:hypothetical protein